MRVRSEHWQVILDFSENNTELITGKFSCSQGKTKANELWLTLANRLNSMGFGEKSVESWRKALVDWKSKTKAKAAAIKREAEKTGGGSTILLPLTELESRLLALMGTTAISGDERVPELGLGEVSIKNTSLADTQSLSFSTIGTVEPIVEKSATTSHDHNYGHKAELKRSAMVERRRSKRLRPVQRADMTKELVELSKDTVTILNSINENISDISQSLKVIANVLQSNYSK